MKIFYNFIKLSLYILLFVLIVIIGAYLIKKESLLSVIIFLLIGSSGVYFNLRLILSSPSLIVDNKAYLRRSWFMTKGQTFNIFVILFLMYGLLILINFLFNFLETASHEFITHLTTNEYLVKGFDCLLIFISILIQFYCLISLIATISLLYQKLKNRAIQNGTWQQLELKYNSNG